MSDSVEKKYMAVLQYRGGKLLFLRYDTNVEFCKEVANFCASLFAHYRIVKSIFAASQVHEFGSAMNNFFDYGSLHFETGAEQRWCARTMQEDCDNALDVYLQKTCLHWIVANEFVPPRQAAQQTQILQSALCDQLRKQALLLKTYMREYEAFAQWCNSIPLDEISAQLYPNLQCIVFIYFYLDLVRLCHQYNEKNGSESQAFLRSFFHEFPDHVLLSSALREDLKELQRCTSASLASESETCRRILAKKYQFPISSEAFDFLRHAIAMEFLPALVRAKLQAHIEFSF